MTKPPRKPTRDELLLWKEITKQDKRFREVPVEGEAAFVLEPSFIAPPAAKKKLRTLGLAPLTAGATDNIDKRTAQKFHQGKREIEATLDLHGFTRDEAHRALTRFIERAYAKHQRMLLVITGKGRIGEGVLRAHVPKLLSLGEIRPYILAYSNAKPKDGGGGAWYILLKRQR